MVRPNAGLVLLARLFSVHLNVNMAAHLSTARLFGPRKKHLLFDLERLLILDFLFLNDNVILKAQR